MAVFLTSDPSLRYCLELVERGRASGQACIVARRDRVHAQAGDKGPRAGQTQDWVAVKLKGFGLAESPLADGRSRISLINAETTLLDECKMALNWSSLGAGRLPDRDGE